MTLSRQKAHNIDDAIHELSRTLGREPTGEDITRHLDISQQEYLEYMLLEQEVIINDSLRAALATLDRHEQLILTLY